MIYVIFDDGNLVESFEDERAAMAALSQLATPEAKPHLLLVAFDQDGEPVADCIPGERLVIPA